MWVVWVAFMRVLLVGAAIINLVLAAPALADGAPLILTHNGSNGSWLAEVHIWPKHRVVLLAATNVENDEAEKAMKELRDVITKRLHPMD